MAEIITNLTEDGKIKTIRYLKATHDDFSKLVTEGKKIMKEISEMEAASGTTLAGARLLAEKNPGQTVNVNGMEKAALWLYAEFLRLDGVLEGYNNAYKFLMEEGVDELLLSINIGAESYEYNFYKLCLNN